MPVFQRPPAIALLLSACVASSVWGQASEIKISQRYGATEEQTLAADQAAGTTHLGGAALGRITGIGVAEDGAVYVLDSQMHKVAVFEKTGELRRVFGGAGSGPGEFKDPIAFALEPGGALAVLDRGNGRVSRFDAKGQYLGGFPLAMSRPTSIAWSDGALWIVRMPAAPGEMSAWSFSESGERKDSVIALTAAETEISRSGGAIAAAAGPRGRGLYLAGPIPGIWRLHVNGATHQRGEAQFEGAMGSVNTLPDGREVRRTNVHVRGLGVRDDGSVVMLYDHPDQQGNQILWLHHMSGVGETISRLQLPAGIFVSALAVDGEDVLVGATEDVPQVWRIPLPTRTQ